MFLIKASKKRLIDLLNIAVKSWIISGRCSTCTDVCFLNEKAADIQMVVILCQSKPDFAIFIDFVGIEVDAVAPNKLFNEIVAPVLACVHKCSQSICVLLENVDSSGIEQEFGDVHLVHYDRSH